MGLIQMLQEASSLGIGDLKKAILRDKKAALLLKKDLTLGDIENPEEFLANAKYYVFNNESVKDFVSSRHDIKNLNKHIFADLRKIRSAELTEAALENMKNFLHELFKEHSSVSKGVLSPALKKELKDWLINNRNHHDLYRRSQHELMSIPGIRPAKRIQVYRGVLFSEYSLREHEKYDGTMEEGNGLKFIRAIKKGGKEIDLHWDRPSSWTINKSVAERFAQFGAASSNFDATMQWFDRNITKRAIDGELGYVISTFVKPEHVLIDTALTPELLGAHGDEGEVILKPGTYLTRIVKKYTVQGEIAPTVDFGANVKIDRAVEKTIEFGKTFLIPEEFDKLMSDGKPPPLKTFALIEDPHLFKLLLLNSSTTLLVHTFDRIVNFYNKELIDISNSELRRDLFIDDTSANAASKLKDFLKFFRNEINYSKSNNTSGKVLNTVHELSGEEFRMTVNSSELKSLEKDLLTHGRIVNTSTEYAFRYLANAVKIDVPTSFSRLSVAKQQPVIDATILAFLNKIGVSSTDDKTENIKKTINLIRKAYRNLALLRELIWLGEKLQEVK